TTTRSSSSTGRTGRSPSTTSPSRSTSSSRACATSSKRARKRRCSSSATRRCATATSCRSSMPPRGPASRRSASSRWACATRRLVRAGTENQGYEGTRRIRRNGPRLLRGPSFCTRGKDPFTAPSWLLRLLRRGSFAVAPSYPSPSFVSFLFARSDDPDALHARALGDVDGFDDAAVGEPAVAHHEERLVPAVLVERAETRAEVLKRHRLLVDGDAAVGLVFEHQRRRRRRIRR